MDGNMTKNNDDLFWRAGSASLKVVAYSFQRNGATVKHIASCFSQKVLR